MLRLKESTLLCSLLLALAGCKVTVNSTSADEARPNPGADANDPATAPKPVELDEDITLLETDPYERGWLYEVRGAPDTDASDVHAYVGVLDAIIDKMLAEQDKGMQQ